MIIIDVTKMMKSSHSNVLIVDRDDQYVTLLGEYLSLHGIQYHSASTANDALTYALCHFVDLVILELDLPDENGLVVLRKLVGAGVMPILVCAKCAPPDTRIAALELGAVDVVVKPVTARELYLRVLVHIGVNRNTENSRSKPFPKLLSRFLLDVDRKLVIDESTANISRLTYKEFQVLVTMWRRPGKVFRRADIIDALTELDGPEHDRSVDISITRLRKKIEPDPRNPILIKTANGFGYYLCDE